MSFSLTNISKSYGENRALQQVSFETGKGELFGLIGPDGAGKSSLLRILATLLLPDSGEAQISGLDVEKDFREIRKIIGYMPGRFSLYQDLTVRENMEFYATVFGTTVSEHYDLVKDIYAHIEPFEKRLAGKLSGGMKQKLALSCALIHRPEVLILDEPTTGVDAVSRMEFWEMLKKIQKEGITILVSTPYMDEAAMCDRIGLIQKSELLSVSKPDELTFGDEQLVCALRTEGSAYSYLEKVRNSWPDIATWLFGDELHLYMNRSQFEGVANGIASWKDEPVELLEIEPSVEDYFMHLMNLKNK